jgi:hypothetical protein
LLEAKAAEYRFPLGGFEWDSGFCSTLGANGARLGTYTRIAAGTLSLALFAMPRVVLELFVVEKHLLTRSKNKLCAAVDAFQYAIRKFHGRLPRKAERIEIGLDLGKLAGPGSCFRTAAISTRARAAQHRRLTAFSPVKATETEEKPSRWRAK